MELKEYYESLIGLEAGWHKIEYSWRDVALYALGCGAHMDEKDFFFEKDMKVLPSFGALPYFNTLTSEPKHSTLNDAVIRVSEILSKKLGVAGYPLDFDHELIIHRPIDPIKGTLVYNDVVTDIYDRGDKGIVVKGACEVYDEAGRLLCVNKSTSAWPHGGNFGGEPYPSSPVVFPDREPDVVVDDRMSETQAALYRLSGDTSYIHIDPDFARSSGQGAPIMHGFCSMGFACRMAIRAVIPGQPERMTRLVNQFRNVAYPDREIQLKGWIVEEGKMYFRLLDKETGKAILDRGQFEWK